MNVHVIINILKKYLNIKIFKSISQEENFQKYYESLPQMISARDALLCVSCDTIFNKATFCPRCTNTQTMSVTHMFRDKINPLLRLLYRRGRNRKQKFNAFKLAKNSI